MYEAIKKTRTKIGRIVKKGSIGEASYKNPPKSGPIENPNPGATIANPVSYTHLTLPTNREV